MIKLIIPIHNKEIFETYLKSSLINRDIKTYEVSGSETIFQKYNIGIKEVLKELNDEDIVCFIHEDVVLYDPLFNEKLEYVFANKKDIGLVGVIGAEEFNEHGQWWKVSNGNKLVGHIIQEVEGKDAHLIKGNIRYSDKIVVLDGLFFAIRGNILKDEKIRFDESLNTNHFYDIDFCLNFLLNTNYKIAVCDILLKHKSVGMGSLTDEWKLTKDKVINKYRDKNIKFPIIESIKNV